MESDVPPMPPAPSAAASVAAVAPAGRENRSSTRAPRHTLPPSGAGSHRRVLRAVGRPAEAAPRNLRGPSFVLVALLVVAIPAASFVLLLGDGVPGGDSGQWVMLARSYAGQTVPAYRDTSAVPPAAPLLVLGLEHLGADPFLAVKVALGLALGAVALSMFLLGRALFGDLAGLVSAVLLVAGQSMYVRLANFGALPQVLALAGFALSLGAIAAWSQRPTFRGQLAILGSLGLVLASHLPTSVVALPVLGVVLLLVPLRDEPGPRKAWWSPARALQRGWPALPSAGLLAAYLLSKRGVFDSYVTNEATYYYKGLGVAVRELLRLQVTSATLVLAIALLGLVLLRGVLALMPEAAEGRSATPRGPMSFLRRLGAVPARSATSSERARLGAVRAAVVLALPATLLGVLTFALSAAHVGTDYPRIFPLIGVPVLAAVGLVVPRLTARAHRAAPRLAGTEARAAALAGLVLTPIVAGVAVGEVASVGTFSVASPADLRAVLEQVQLRTPPDATVLAPIREGKWLEGATGRAALFALQPWAIFRPWEWERKVAAETIEGRSAWLSTGLLGVAMHRDAGVGASNPEVSAYYKGDLAPVLSLDDAQSTVHFGGPRPTDVPLRGLGQRTELVLSGAGEASVQQTAVGNVAQGDGNHVRLQVDRTVTVRNGSAALLLRVDAHAPGAALQGATLVLRPAEGATWTLADASTNSQVTLLAQRGAQPVTVHIDVAVPGSATLRTRADGAVLADLPSVLTTDGLGGTRSDAQTSLVISVTPVGSPHAKLEAETAEDALAAYHVGYALLPRGAEPERTALAGLGFHAIYENPSYLLLQREAPR